MKKNKSIPVLMYHSVGVPNAKWQWNYLTCPFLKFENHLRILKSNGYHSINLNELYEYMINGKCVPSKSISITFDDGYLDNYIFAYPLLKKYGFCATVFINPDFVDNRAVIRKRLDQVQDVNELESAGFLSWLELEIMEKEKVIFTESHALTHTWYPVSEEIVDFRQNGDRYIWMSWNSNTELKPFLQIDNDELIIPGEPVYKNEKSLMAKRFYFNKEYEKYMVDFVKRRYSNSNKNQWKYALENMVLEYKNLNNSIGRIETDDEYRLRISHELLQSKSILENKLNKKIFFLCWPGGSATAIGMDEARKAGYKFFTAAKDINKKERNLLRNSILCKSDRITRFAPVFLFNGKENSRSYIIYSSGWQLYLQVKANEIGGVILRLYKMFSFAINKAAMLLNR